MIATLPKAPLTLAALKEHGRWWWFCDDEAMKALQPVLVSYEDKYDPESPCYFAHPWPSESWEKDLEMPKHSEHFRWVKNWSKCFFGPCLTASEAGADLSD